MSIELDQIKKAVADRQQELDTAARNKRLEDEKKQAEENRKKEQKACESQKRSDQNREVFKSVGIIKLFEEIKNSGIVKAKNEPQYKQVPKYRESIFGKRTQVGEERVKISDYEPARIEWGTENRSVTLAFNISSDKGDNYSSGYYYDDHITFALLDNGEIEFSGHIAKSRCDKYRANDKDENITKKIEKPSDIPKLIADQISKTIN
jgi:hypothetical protein